MHSYNIAAVSWRPEKWRSNPYNNMNIVAVAPIFIYSVSSLESVEKSFSEDMQLDFPSTQSALLTEVAVTVG